MRQNIFSQLQDDGQSHLHWLPFIIIWCSAYAMSWIVTIGVVVILDLALYSIDIDWIYDLPYWLTAIVSGTIYGLVLGTIQIWAIRQRYGFVPRFYGIATVIGSMIALFAINFFVEIGFPRRDIWGVGLFWFGILNLFQAAVLFRVNRKAWLLILVGFSAGIVAGNIYLHFDNGWYFDAFPLAAFSGTVVQSIGTALAMLYLMAHPREGIVPKRDTIETIHHGMSPLTFTIALVSTYLIGWGTALVSGVSTYLIRWVTALVSREFARAFEDFMYNISNWIEHNGVWTSGIVPGLIIGVFPIIAQPWLMRRYHDVSLPHWRVLSAIGYVIGGIGLGVYGNYLIDGDLKRYGMLAVWFVAPVAFQSLSIWKSLRGGWMWSATGVVAFIIAMMVDAQFSEFLGRAEISSLTLVSGIITQAIITGVTYVLLSSQQRDAEKPKAVVDA